MIPKCFSFSLLALIAMQIISCNKQDSSEVQQLRWIDKANPAIDAQMALANGDHRLRAVRGLTIIIPGTERAQFQAYEKSYGIFLIEGTSDCLVSKKHSRLVSKAFNYAIAYNAHIIQSYKPQAAP